MKKHFQLSKTPVLLLFVTSLLISPVLTTKFISASEGDIYTYIGGVQDLEDELAKVQAELKVIREARQNLKTEVANEQYKQGIYQGKLGKLQAEVEELQLDIAEIELQIEELEIGINNLEKLIAEKEAEIGGSEDQITSLEEETTQRISTSYRAYRTGRRYRTDLLDIKNPNSYFRDSQYREILQERTNAQLEELTELKLQLQRDREELSEKQTSVRRDKAVLDERKTQIEKLQQELKEKIKGYNSALYISQQNIQGAQRSLEVYSAEKARKMARAEKLRQQIFNSFRSIPAGRKVEVGTQIGRQGSTGWSTGPHLHFITKYNGAYQNPCTVLPSGVIGGCGGSGRLEWPMRGNFYYTSRYYSGVNGDVRCFWYNGKYSCSSHRAIDIANSIWNAPIYAAHDGWLVKGKDQYGALYIVICEHKNNCNKGWQTGYWHLSQY